jgi:hypothetical protein
MTKINSNLGTRLAADCQWSGGRNVSKDVLMNVSQSFSVQEACTLNSSVSVGQPYCIALNTQLNDVMSHSCVYCR